MGQNFLIEPSIAKQQVDYAEINNTELVLEIGAGIGILTYFIKQKSDRIIVIEKDKRLCEHLRETFKENIEILCTDALKITLPQVDKIISNLPYSISSDIMFKIISETNFKKAILMLQEEFIERIMAKPGSEKYGRLSIGVNRFCNVRVLRKVSKNSFYPIPKVDSTIIELTRKQYNIDDDFEIVFYETVKGIFNFPRKTLRSAIHQWLKRTPETLQKVISCPEISQLLDKRVRQITINDFEIIAKCVQLVKDDDANKIN